MPPRFRWFWSELKVSEINLNRFRDGHIANHPWIRAFFIYELGN
jgi:hypothetical protein